MLKQRVLTALPLAALVVWGMLTQSSQVIFYALLVITLISSWEWSRLSGIQQTVAKIIYTVLLTLAAYLLQIFINESLLMIVLSVTVLGWLIAIYHMFAVGPQAYSEQFSAIKAVIGYLALIPPVIALMHIHSHGAWWLFYSLSIVWVADIGAYFAGKRFGYNKLAPKLSPGKTKEGMYGAVFATSVYSFVAGFLFELSVIQLFLLLIISALTTFISVAGDLFISLLKRERNLKDTGNILPGHGGILDRIDSVTSSAPFLALLLNLVIFNV